MLYLTIYDISKNNIRSKVSSKCKNYGMRRIQKSAFAGKMSNNKAEMLHLEISKIVEAGDCVFMLPSCKFCFASKLIAGTFDEEKLKTKDYELIN